MDQQQPIAARFKRIKMGCNKAVEMSFEVMEKEALAAMLTQKSISPGEIDSLISIMNIQHLQCKLEHEIKKCFEAMFEEERVNNFLLGCEQAAAAEEQKNQTGMKNALPPLAAGVGAADVAAAARLLPARRAARDALAARLARQEKVNQELQQKLDQQQNEIISDVMTLEKVKAELQQAVNIIVQASEKFGEEERTTDTGNTLTT